MPTMLHAAPRPKIGRFGRRGVARILAVGACLATVLGADSTFAQTKGKGQGQPDMLEAAARTELRAGLPDAYSPLPTALAALRKTITLEYPEVTPVETMLKAISDATKSPKTGLLRDGLQFFLDPVSFARRDHRVPNPKITFTCQNIPVHRALSAIAEKLRMVAYIQRDGVVIFMKRSELDGHLNRRAPLFSEWFWRPYTGGEVPAILVAGTPDQEHAWALFSGQWTLPFHNEAPLEDLVDYIGKVVKPKPPGRPLAFTWEQAPPRRPNPRRMPFRLATGFIPFRTALALALDANDLGYVIEPDGTIVIKHIR